MPRLMQQTTDGSSGGSYNPTQDYINLPSSVTATPSVIGNSPAYQPQIQDPNIQIADPTAGAATTPAAPSNWLSTIGNFLTSPTAGALATGGVGLYQAGQVTKASNQAAGQIQGTVQPGQNVSTATYGQLTGKGTVGGPMGASIAGQTTAAGELTGVAQQYGTGQLTTAQQQQIQATVAAQKAQYDQQFAATGGMDSSARAAAHQQIDNNAAILTQQLINQNLQMAEGAQTSVSNTYNSLLQNALNQATLGLRGTSEAVNTQLQNNQQVQQYLQQIMSGIATQLGTASGGGSVAGQGGKPGATTPQTPGAQLGGVIGQGIQAVGNYFGIGNTPAVSATDLASYSAQTDAAIAAMPIQALTFSDMSS